MYLFTCNFLSLSQMFGFSLFPNALVTLRASNHMLDGVENDLTLVAHPMPSFCFWPAHIAQPAPLSPCADGRDRWSTRGQKRLIIQTCHLLSVTLRHLKCGHNNREKCCKGQIITVIVILFKLRSYLLYVRGCQKKNIQQLVIKNVRDSIVNLTGTERK